MIQCVNTVHRKPIGQNVFLHKQYTPEKRTIHFRSVRTERQPRRLVSVILVVVRLEDGIPPSIRLIDGVHPDGFAAVFGEVQDVAVAEAADDLIGRIDEGPAIVAAAVTGESRFGGGGGVGFGS